jgi:hypothetical protein
MSRIIMPNWFALSRTACGIGVTCTGSSKINCPSSKLVSVHFSSKNELTPIARRGFSPSRLGHQPVHPAAQLAILAGPDGQVEVVGHEAVGQDAHRGTDSGLGHHFEEGVIILASMEHRGPGVPPVQDVVGVTS